MLLGIWGKEIFTLWLGKDFGDTSAVILKILLVGIVFNCLNWVPFTFIQSSRYIRWTVYIPLMELVFFVFIFFPLVGAYGPVGAAAAWSLRLVVDAVIWFGLSLWIFKKRFSKRL